MLLKIDVRPEDIIQNTRGRLIIKLHYYAAFATGPHLNTVEGSTLEDFERNKAKAGKTIFVGSKGGISF